MEIYPKYFVWKIVPDSAKWSNVDDIITVLNFLGRMPNINHMFVPSGGGEDFESAEKQEKMGVFV